MLASLSRPFRAFLNFFRALLGLRERSKRTFIGRHVGARHDAGEEVNVSSGGVPWAGSAAAARDLDD